MTEQGAVLKAIDAEAKAKARLGEAEANRPRHRDKFLAEQRGAARGRLVEEPNEKERESQWALEQAAKGQDTAYDEGTLAPLRRAVAAAVVETANARAAARDALGRTRIAAATRRVLPPRSAVTCTAALVGCTDTAEVLYPDLQVGTPLFRVFPVCAPCKLKLVSGTTGV